MPYCLVFHETCSFSYQQTNTFQCVVVVSGNEPFSIYLFADGSMQWTTSDADGGHRGIGGEAAQVGYITTNVQKYLLPGSGTCSIIEVPLWSNVNVPGMFVLALNGPHPAFGTDVHILSYFAAYIHILEDVNCVLLCGFLHIALS